MSSDYFHASLGKEKRGNPLVEAFLRKRLRLLVLKNISTEPDGIKQDIDYVGKSDPTAPWLRIEVKQRTRRFRDLLIEVRSCKERDTPGWIYTSKADLLAYLWVYAKSANGFVFDLPALRKWWESGGFYHGYREVLAPNPPPPQKAAYHTQNFAVPLRDLPADVYEGGAR